MSSKNICDLCGNYDTFPLYRNNKVICSRCELDSLIILKEKIIEEKPQKCITCKCEDFYNEKYQRDWYCYKHNPKYF